MNSFMADKKFRNVKKRKKSKILSQIKEKLQALVSSKKDYTEALGRRKTATARVRMYKSDEGKVVVNGKDLNDFFGTEELVNKVQEALNDIKESYLITVLVKGSGINAQAEAIRLGIARALIKINPELRGDLKEKGFLKRDPRSVERKKPGLKKARKAPTWVKR